MAVCALVRLILIGASLSETHIRELSGDSYYYIFV